MTKTITLIAAILVLGCSTKKSATSSNSAQGDTRTKKVVLLDDYTYRLTEKSTDSTYAYTQLNAVKVGGSKESSGPKNEQRFLNGLAGPNGEQIKYFRAGSCCAFETPNGMMGGGLLDKYRVYWKGCKDTLNIYINMYDKGDLLIPVGLTGKTAAR